MPRNISFALTTEQIRNRTKTVTRRLGWKNLKKGDILNACVKCMGLKKGEKPEKLGLIRVVDVRREPLDGPYYGQKGLEESRREGFDFSYHKFVEMFCKHMGGDKNQEVTRIEFEYINEKY
jgi:hypothetical protein